MKAARVLAMVVPALPVFAQYAGPAILSRGDAPASMSSAQISFRPYVSLKGEYDTGLAGASVTETGGIAHESSFGTLLGWGVEGTHSWKRTKIALDYHGTLSYYTYTSFFANIEESLLLGVSHQLTRHSFLTLRQSAGIFTRPLVRTGLQQTVPFDPSTTYIPTTDYFDNRTYYASSQVGLTIQKTARLSMNMGGDAFMARRRSRALYGTNAISAHGDIQYRLTRRTTIGATYTYSNFRFPRIFGGSDVHGMAGTFATALSSKLEFSGFAGINRAESQFLEVVTVDPVITALLGITAGTRVKDMVIYGPLLGIRLSRTFSRGVAYLGGGHSFTPGNGLFLTSQMSTGMAGYSYTGFRRWGLGANVTYSRGKAYGPIQGIYNTASAGLNASRTLTRGMHMTWNYSARRYSSPNYANYNRLVHQASLGLAFSPGETPLRLW